MASPEQANGGEDITPESLLPEILLEQEAIRKRRGYSRTDVSESLYSELSPGLRSKIDSLGIDKSFILIGNSNMIALWRGSQEQRKKRGEEM